VSDDLFGDLFPGSANGFDVSLNWKQTNMFLWYAGILADDMTRYAASYRQPTDMFGKGRIWGLLSLYKENVGRMAKVKGRAQDERPEWRGFLDYRMSDEQVMACDNWKPKPSEMWDLLDGMLLADYRLTLSYNKRTKLASVTIVDEGGRSTAGWALSTSDTDGALALKAACFKHYTLLGQDWSGLLDQPQKARRG